MNTNGDRPPAAAHHETGPIPIKCFSFSFAPLNIRVLNNCHQLNHDTLFMVKTTPNLTKKQQHGQPSTLNSAPTTTTTIIVVINEKCNKMTRIWPPLVCLECLGNYTEEEMNEALGILAIIMIFFLAVCSCQVNSLPPASIVSVCHFALHFSPV